MTEMRLTATRGFDRLPDAVAARALLHEIAAATADPRPRPVDKKLALYGAGDMGRMARAHLDRIGVPIAFVVDRQAARLREMPDWQGVTLLTPDAVPDAAKRDTLLAVCVATAPYAPLEAGLAAAGWADIVPFYDIAEAYRDRHPLSNGWVANPFSPEDEAGIAAALDHWADDLSRAHHLQFLAWRRLRAEWNFDGAPVTLDDRYFIPEVRHLLTATEGFADIGAYHGGVIRRFLEITGGRCGRLWAVEPDPANLARLREAMTGLPEEFAVQIIPAVVAAEAGQARFAGGLGYAAQISEVGVESLPVTTIDRLGLSPSFLKLHLEGGELAALQGATETLKRCRPLVALTSYHNDLGLWRLPLWLRETLPDYRLLMRLHSYVGTGAVIYVIPEERLGAEAP
ncbi:FkbM family methyltransferase [Oceanibaculum nanhaiense]|uniref:FkbM family methyltransferase n=1 Tax=Oceanibaculum nanhaiense TaxID=1909734 RepID=UPI00396EA8C9